MGIPRFLRRMRDAGYGSIDTIGSTDAPRTKTKAILDGPSLAHYIYKNLTSRKPPPHTAAIDLPIAYSDCGRATIAWLDELQQIGFEIETIFFDGALPEAKRETRIERLRNYASQRAAYKALHDAAARADRGRKSKSGVNIWAASELQSAHRNLPPIPFLVPAVVEALLDSPYRSLVYVVPGEADAFCVAAAIECNAVDTTADIFIFTNDSDLVVFDAGTRTSIVMLNEMRRTVVPTGILLSGLVVKSSDLARHCGVANLVELAYQMATHHQTPMKVLAQNMASSPVAHDDGYLQFAQTYHVDGQRAFWSSIRRDTHQQAIDAALDARLSEVVFQAQCSRHTDSSQPIHAFLPFLLEDPSRGSAWNVGARIRQLAYSIVLQAYNQPSAGLIEFRRSGHRIAETSLPVASLDELCDESSQLVKLLDDAMTDPQGEKSSRYGWRCAALSFLLQDLEEVASFPSTNEFVAATATAIKPTTSWVVTHLAAQYAAAFYSLRMWHQALHWVSAARRENLDALPSEVKEALSQLQDRLDGMPSLAVFFDLDENENGSEVVREYMAAKLLVLQPPAPSSDHAVQKKARKKRQSTITRHSEGATKKRPREDSNNPFAALSCD